ncbi:carbohydrate ABC transporter permease [Burkholderia guangdongensis]|uniref:carbohydrate ABC transporter permease n=1 Tax=Burkholderia guangdongensis TaxID=1792500 RepID=UPI0015CA1F93|nr:carbohydrate ABC transporter permease [Burkholderia guangdongensis]
MSDLTLKHRRRIGQAVSYALLTLFTLVFLLPTLFMLVSGFKHTTAIFADLRSWRALLPVGDLTFENYRYVFERGNFERYFVNSVVVTSITVVLSVVVNSMAAYALARLHWRGRKGVFALVIAILIIPFEAIAIPLVMLVSQFPGVDFGLHGLSFSDSMFNTYTVQILPFAANAFTIFLFFQFFRDLPIELDEAARLDGATPFQIYWRIVMPLSRPVIATVAILQFLTMWNQYLWPIMVVQSGDVRPLMPGIQEFFNRSPAWGQIMAYASLVTLPVLAIFVTFQRWFVQSVASSGVKG